MPPEGIVLVSWSRDRPLLSDGCLEADISPSLAQSSQYDDLRIITTYANMIIWTIEYVEIEPGNASWVILVNLNKDFNRWHRHPSDTSAFARC